jgi:hypothetical protein
VLIAFDLLEHPPDNGLFSFAADAYRVLKSGGRLIIHTRNGRSPFGMMMRYGDITHTRAFTRNSIEQLLRANGFSDIRCIGSAPMVHGLKSAMRALIWKVTRGLLRLWLMAEMGTARDAILTQNFLVVAIKT